MSGPIQCEGLANLGVVQVACAEKRFLILSRNGRVYTQAYNSETLVRVCVFKNLFCITPLVCSSKYLQFLRRVVGDMLIFVSFLYCCIWTFRNSVFCLLCWSDEMHMGSVIFIRLEVMDTIIIAFIGMLALVASKIGRYEMDFTLVI